MKTMLQSSPKVRPPVSTRKRISLMLLLIGACTAGRCAEDPSDATKTFKAEFDAIAKQLRSRAEPDREKALSALPALEKTAATPQDRCAVYGLQIQSGAEKPAYAKKMLAVPEATTQQKTQAITALVGTCDLGTRFRGYYVDMELGKRDLARMRKQEIAYREELAELNPSNADLLNNLGNAYIEAEAADKAAAAFNQVTELEKLTDLQLGDALLGLANAAILKNDRAVALRHCQDLVDRHLNTTRRYGTRPSLQADLALQYLGGYKLDRTRLPFDTGAKAFPTAQQSRYSDTFVPLKTVSLKLGKGLKESDPRILLLKQKFDRFGIGFEKEAPFVIRIGTDDEPSPPAKPEGYTLTVTEEGAVINGFDRQGVLWGVVTLIQVIDQKKGAIRVCEIADCPNTARRGFLERYWPHTLEFALFAKMNSVTAQTGLQLVYNEGYRPWTPLQKAVVAETCRQFSALGLDHYFGIRGLAMYPKLPLSSERTLDLLVERCRFVAKLGGHIYFPYDDGRYPLHPADVEAYGSGTKMDAKRVNALYKAVHAKYPSFKLVFCPPYYAVPDGMHETTYPDNRDEYLKSIGDHLDPAVQVYWTGPRVAGLAKPKEKRDYYANLIKRNPAIFQNRVRPHNHLSYITDVITGWKEWHYDGFVENDITMFHKNGCSTESTLVLTLADYLWNVKAYDAERSIREAVAILYGSEMFDILDPGTQAMAYLDKYIYGQMTPEGLTEIPKIETCYTIAKACYEKALAYNGFSMTNYPGSYGRGVGFAKRALDGAKNPPDFMKRYQKDIEETRAFAEKEVGIDEAKGDLFKSPIDFFGGRFIVYANQCPKRFANLLYGKQTPAPTVTLKFESYPFPPEGDYELHISGQQEPVTGDPPCAIRISINGKTVFEGPSTFVHNGWSLETFVLPFDAVLRYNVVTIENIEDSSNPQGPPWFMINYGVLKKATR